MCESVCEIVCESVCGRKYFRSKQTFSIPLPAAKQGRGALRPSRSSKEWEFFMMLARSPTDTRPPQLTTNSLLDFGRESSEPSLLFRARAYRICTHTSDWKEERTRDCCNIYLGTGDWARVGLPVALDPKRSLLSICSSICCEVHGKFMLHYTLSTSYVSCAHDLESVGSFSPPKFWRTVLSKPATTRTGIRAWH